MSEPRQLGEASDYNQLIAIYRARMAQLGLTFEQIDELSGLHYGYSNKILGPRQAKTLGQISMPLLNKTLAVKLVVIEDLDALIEMAPRWTARKTPMLAPASMRRQILTIGPRQGRKMAQDRWAKVAPADRKKHARKMARARWKRVRETL